MTATKTGDNGWQNAFWEDALKGCKVKIHFKRDGDSGNILIGVTAATGDYNVSTFLGSDSNSDSWMWYTNNGEMHTRGN